MAGSALTSGYDLVVQINANNFAAVIEANPTFRALSNLRIIPLSPTQNLTFTPPLQIRFYHSAAEGQNFELDLSLENAQYLSGSTPTPFSLGAGRSLIRVPTRINKDVQPQTPPGSLGETQRLFLRLQPNLSNLQFQPIDSSGLPLDVTVNFIATQLRNFLQTVLPPQGLDLTNGGILLIPDSTNDPLPVGQIRDLDVLVLNRTAMTTDAVAIALRLQRDSLDIASNLLTGGSNVGPLEGGALILSNNFVFSQIRAALVAQGVPADSITVNTPPTTLSILPGTPVFGAEVNSFNLTAAGSNFALSASLRKNIEVYVITLNASGTVSFAFGRGGNLVVGTNLSTSIDIRMTGLGAFIIGILAVAGAALTVFTVGAGSAAAGAIAFGIGIAAGFVIGRIIDEIVQAIIRMMGPSFQLQLQNAFSSAGGGVIPGNLLSGLGVGLNFEPPVVFDDLKLGVSLRQSTAIGELRRESGVSVPSTFAIDLDSGIIYESSAVATSGADLIWDGSLLRAGLGSRLVLISERFLDATHADLERLMVGPSITVSGIVIPRIEASGLVPEPLTIGVRTNQRRHAKVALWQDRTGRLLLRYVLYNDLIPNARIFASNPAWRRIETIRDADTPASFLEPARRNFREAHEGSFRVLHHRLQLPVAFAWRIGDYDLTALSGTVIIGGQTLFYSMNRDTCSLRTALGANLRANLRCSLTDASGTRISDEVELFVNGNRSEAFGRSGVQVELDRLEHQFRITRTYFLPG